MVETWKGSRHDSGQTAEPNLNPSGWPFTSL